MAGQKGRTGTKGGGKTGISSHRPDMDREQRLLEMMKLLRRGYTKASVAQKLGVHRTQITYDYKVVVKRLVEERDEETKAYIALKLEEYAEVKTEAWQAWELSKGRARKTTEEWGRKRARKDKGGVDDDGGGEGDGGGSPTPRFKPSPSGMRGSRGGALTPQELSCELELVKRTEAEEARLPDPGYLRVVMACLEAERELLGLNPPKKVEMSGEMTATTFDWAALAAAIPEGEVPDAIEQAMARVLMSRGGLSQGARELASGVGGDGPGGRGEVIEHQGAPAPVPAQPAPPTRAGATPSLPNKGDSTARRSPPAPSSKIGGGTGNATGAPPTGNGSSKGGKAR